MLLALGLSVLFLCTYIAYHSFQIGPTRYSGDYPWVYYPILISHIILATVILPMALLTLYRGWTGQIESHRPLARITLPLWLYVSATGVIIYGMLYHGIW